MERDVLVAKKDRKQRRKDEQASAKVQSLPMVIQEAPEVDPMDGEESEVEVALDIDAFEPIDFDDLRGAW
jgi:hypothetical protein